MSLFKGGRRKGDSSKDELKLPSPDPYGNFWLGLPREPPCILTIKSIPKLQGKYMVTTSSGVVWRKESDGSTGLRAFDTPDEALEFLRDLV